jgi:uncharacterized protein YggE
MFLKGFLLTLFIFAAQIAAQDRPEKLPPSIQTSGEAKLTAQPDRAQIDLGVVTQANSSQAAAEQNARKLEAVLSRLRQLVGAGADIKTISYTIQPVYLYPKEGGEPQITGYTATNVVRVLLDDLTKVGSVIDTATQAGANRVQNLQFMLRTEDVVQAQALRDAATKARNKADALASALGLKILRVLSVVETSPGFVPVRDVAYARAEAAATPIEPGTIDVRATVTLTVEMSTTLHR